MAVKVREKVKGSGEWWVFIDHKGKRKSQKIGPDRQLALEAAKQINAQIVLGMYDFEQNNEKSGSCPTFESYYRAYFGGFSALKHKPGTRDNLANIVEKHLLPRFGKTPLKEITRSDIKSFLMRKQQERKKSKDEKKSIQPKYAPNTIRLMQGYLSGIMTQAVDDEIITVNPARGAGRYILSKKRVKEIEPFTWQEKRVFECAMKELYPRHYPLFLCLLRTGMRLGEAIALKPGDLDFLNKVILVQRNFPGKQVVSTKTNRKRQVDMSPQLEKVLGDYLEKRMEIASEKGWDNPPEWLFFNEEGGLIDQWNLRKRVFYPCLEKVGLRRITPHDLRHTYATLRIQAGHSIPDVSRQLGHSSIRTTIDTYYHWMPGTKRKEVEELDGYGE
jgi:integrase